MPHRVLIAEDRQTTALIMSGALQEAGFEVKVMDAFSAHADQRELLDYLALNRPDQLKRIFLVHGEPDQALPLKDTLLSQGYPQVHYPAPGETFSL